MNSTVEGAETPSRSLSASLSQLSMIVGFGGVGLSAFVLLAAGPRILGPDGYSALALTWTIVTIVGIGIASPGEQTITRGLASGAGTGIVIAVGRRLLLVPLGCLIVLPIALNASGKPVEDKGLWVGTVCMAALSWVGLACVRGLLAGRHRFAAYAVTLATEAIVRIGTIGFAFFAGDGRLMLSLSVFLPLALSAAVGWALYQRRGEDFEAPITEDSRLEQVSITGVALMGQICLSTAPLWLSWQSPDAAIAGAFVSATSYMRVPLLLAGGLYGPILADAARQYAAGNRGAVASRTFAGLVAGAGGSSFAVVVLLLISGPALMILYDGDIGLSNAVLIWMGVTTIGSVASNILTQVMFACQRAPAAALAWVLPAAATTVLLATAAGDVLRMSRDMAIGQLLATAVLLALLPYALPARQPGGARS